MQNNQETITFTVYNQQADSITGVLLTDTLAPGVTLRERIAAAGPERAEPGLEPGHDRGVLLDQREHHGVAGEFQHLAAGHRRPGVRHARRRPDLEFHPAPRRSRTGSCRSQPAAPPRPTPTRPTRTSSKRRRSSITTRRTSSTSCKPTSATTRTPARCAAPRHALVDAGNALDVASLGVALMRASGIPAQYVAGTLSQSQAQQLILSMFPASYQTVGYIPAGTTDLRPRQRSASCCAETESHYWFQFDTGSGWVNADPLMPRRPRSARRSRPRPARSPRCRRTCGKRPRSRSPPRSTARPRAAFGLEPLQDTSCWIRRSTTSIWWAGRSRSATSSAPASSAAFIFTATTNTYTPYIVMGDEAFPILNCPKRLSGKQYQEVLTNFPLASQILTGLFLNITLSGAGTPHRPSAKPLLTASATPPGKVAAPENLSVNPSGPPIITPFDLTTLNILPGLQSPGCGTTCQERANQEVASIVVRD